ncbi:Transcription factor bHLH71 [Vitis vinifera]|uniref:Transcription factor bHLH71 n=1 Tax=Vitis vinifera TaxID=29760 RepID=A0A438K026_VITVI|nr:Transcription factor bHLH71 [Vitis vinifera]
MALEALSSNDLLNFIIYETISATPYTCHAPLEAGFSLENPLKPQDLGGALDTPSTVMDPRCSMGPETSNRKQNLAVQGRKKEEEKGKGLEQLTFEELGTSHREREYYFPCRAIAMKGNLALLEGASVVRDMGTHTIGFPVGDQASIVGGAIEFVKELEHLLQSLEARKHKMLQGVRENVDDSSSSSSSSTGTASPPTNSCHLLSRQFFVYPQYTWSQMPNKYTSKSKAAVADIEVTLIETHANLRILSHKSPRLLSKMVTGFQTLYLTILHLNVTTVDPLVLYSISAKVEEGCQLTSVDDIAGAVHHMLRIIEEEAAVLC